MVTEDRRVDALRDRLVALASARRTITYETLRSELALTGDLVPVLRALSEAEDDAGRGLLTAVVVRADTGRPGAGWFRLAASRGRDTRDEDAAWERERDRLQEVHRDA
jgi:hypothetical protein